MLEKIIISVVTAFLASVVTVSITLRKHKKQHWWNKKLDLYLKILSDLSTMRSICLEILGEPNKPTKIRLQKLSEQWLDLLRELNNNQRMGLLLLSEKAEHELTMLLVHLEIAEDSNRILIINSDAENSEFEADEKQMRIDKTHSLLTYIFKHDFGI